jgi:hypothetical protein
MTANITPEGLREKARKLEVQWIASGEALYVPAHEHIESLNAHAAVLEELARLKAPVEVAGMADNLRQGATVLDEPFHHDAIGDEMCAAAAALEALAARLAVVREQDAMSSKAAYENAITALKTADERDEQRARAERAEQQLAERDAAYAALKGHEYRAGMRAAAALCHGAVVRGDIIPMEETAQQIMDAILAEADK